MSDNESRAREVEASDEPNWWEVSYRIGEENYTVEVIAENEDEALYHAPLSVNRTDAVDFRSMGPVSATDGRADESEPSTDLLTRALPMLVRLGDFIGNGPADGMQEGSLGERCDLILDIKRYLSKFLDQDEIGPNV